MSVIGSNILAGASGQGGGYNLTRSLRLRSSASAYLNRTPASTGNRKTWTYSTWVKRGALGTEQVLISGGVISATYYYTKGLYFDSSDRLCITNYPDASGGELVSTSVYRDPSAWYHVMVAVDTTQATNTNRLKMYVNGVQVTAFSTASYPTQNTDTMFNSTSYPMFLGKFVAGFNQYFDGYKAEENFIDGQALTPSSFGETSSTTGVWQPKKYAGTYGTNGFYLPFTDNSALTTSSNVGLGKDFSGNGNYWNTNNISITAGSTYDSMTDVPTLTSATASNFCTLNPLSTSSYVTISGGNLNTTGNTSADEGVCGSTFMVRTGKWYTEFTVTGSIVSNRPNYGIIPNPNANFANGGGQFANTGGMRYGPDGKVYTSGSLVGTFSTFTTGDVIGIAIDADNGAAYVSKNGTFQNSGVPTSGASKTGAVVTWTGGTVDYFVCVDEYNGTTSATNFGQRPFAYTPPTGFVALNTFNLPTPTIGSTASSQANKYFDILLYTGNGGTQTITGLNFQPTLVWGKARSSAIAHNLFDQVRGGTRQLETNSTAAEVIRAGNAVVFNSNGITLDATYCNINNTSVTNVAWNWAGNGTGVTNTAGSITSTVSANTSSGFSVVTYTGNLTAGATVGHGLGVAPSMVIVKRRGSSGNWMVYHKSLGATKALYLNLTDAANTYDAWWNNTAPTSSVFTLGWGGDVNNNGTMVAYAFSEVAGYSKFSSYAGTGSTNFIYTGFKPKFIMIKVTTSAGRWEMFDISRSPYNPSNARLAANESSAEVTNYASPDFLSNGFKLNSAVGYTNDSGQTYIYMAFAENPFKYSLAQ